MADMLVNLLNLPENADFLAKTALAKNGVAIFRPIAPDKHRVVKWVEKHSGKNAASECEVCFSRMPISCFIACHDDEIIGYGCHSAIAPEFFGPLRVADKWQGQNIGQALLYCCLAAMRQAGFVYGVIGGIGPQNFYEKCVGAVPIKNSTPGIYANFLGK